VVWGRPQQLASSGGSRPLVRLLARLAPRRQQQWLGLGSQLALAVMMMVMVMVVVVVVVVAMMMVV
jgi:hypothetical protein